MIEIKNECCRAVSNRTNDRNGQLGSPPTWPSAFLKFLNMATHLLLRTHPAETRHCSNNPTHPGRSVTSMQLSALRKLLSPSHASRHLRYNLPIRTSRIDWTLLHHYDKTVLGAGLYGLYAAERCGRHGQSALVLEYDNKPFSRATYVNQARVHQGYHYPRSLHTALESAGISSDSTKITGSASTGPSGRSIAFPRRCPGRMPSSLRIFAEPPRFPAKKRSLHDSSATAS